MQAALFSGQGILPKLPGATVLESGKLCKCGMPAADANAAVRAYPILAVHVYRDYYSLAQERHVPRRKPRSHPRFRPPVLRRC